MPVTDAIGDFLTRIRNAQRAHHRTVEAPASKLKIAIAEILKDQGYIADYELIHPEGAVQPTVRLHLKYYQGKPVIREIKRVSKPGIRRYARVNELPRVYNGLGIAIVSTSNGVMTDKEARRQRVGGEIICTVW
ncbi:MAG: 30S ribosomal protein S8 [Candidatus Kapaibacterium sp.]|nr:MAG: 30S ribosomal protein S8 [Candidatus Kapabacteria bacterium]